MKIVADESVDYAIIESLRAAGFDVYSIMEQNPGWPDDQVLALAYQEKAFLVTEDKDFGELTYRLQKPSHGILLIRMPYESSKLKAISVLNVIQQNQDILWNTFSVLEAAKLRIKPMQF